MTKERERKREEKRYNRHIENEQKQKQREGKRGKRPSLGRSLTRSPRGVHKSERARACLWGIPGAMMYDDVM